MRFHALEKLINLGPGYRKYFKIDNLHLLLLNIDGQNYLIDALCPHRGELLLNADIHYGDIVCPYHQYRFSLHTGECLAFTEESCHNLNIYKHAFNGNEIGIWI